MLAICSHFINANITDIISIGAIVFAELLITLFTFLLTVASSVSLLYCFITSIVITYSIIVAIAIPAIPVIVSVTFPYLIANSNSAKKPTFANAPNIPFALYLIIIYINIIANIEANTIVAIFNVFSVISEYSNLLISTLYFIGKGSVFRNTLMFDACFR